MLLAPLAMLGLPGTFGKYTEYFRNRSQLKPFVVRIGIISLSLTAALSVVMISFPQMFSEIFFRDSTQVSLVRCIGITLFAVAFSNYVIALMESLRQVRSVTLMRFVTGIAFAVIGTGMLCVWNDGAAAVTFGYGVCCLLGVIPGLWLIWKFRGTFTESSEALPYSDMWRRIAPFAAWLWVANMLNNLFEVSDRYMLIHFSDTTSDLAQGLVGQYHSGRVVPLLLVSVAAMLGSVLMPYLSAAWEKGNRDAACRQLNWTLKLLGLTFSAGGVLVLLGSPILFDWILQGRYSGGLAVLPLTLVYCIWFSLYYVGQDYLWVAEKGKLATFAIAFGLVANIGLNMLLIPIIGLWGAVIATSIGNLMVLILVFALNHRCGCKTDLGIWFMVALPLTLLLPPWVALAAMALVACLGYSTDWILQAEEKKQISELLQSQLARFRG